MEVVTLLMIHPTEDINLHFFNMITRINETKTLEHRACECRCKFDGRKCNSN